MGSRKRKIYIRWLALLAAAALAIYLCWLMLLPFVNVLAWAAVLVTLFYPIHQRFIDLTGRPSWSAFLSTIIVIAMILIPVTILTLAVAKEVGDLAQKIQGAFHALFDPDSPIMGRIMRWLGRFIDVNQLNPHGYLMDRLNSISASLAGRTLGLVGGLAGAIVQAFFIVFTMYYLFRDGAWIIDAMLQGIPLEPSQTRQIFNRMREVIHASVYGVIVIAGIQGALGGLAFAVLGLHSPLVWGVVMFFLSMVPLAGSFIVWVPAAAYLALSGHWGKALLLVLWGALVIGTIDNILRPKLVGERTRLHELLIFFSVLGGLRIWGVLGLVLGPVVVAITLALLDVLKRIDPPVKATQPAPPAAK